MFSSASIPSHIYCLGQKAREKTSPPPQAHCKYLYAPKDGAAQREKEQDYKWERKEHFQGAKPLGDNWTLLMAVPNATVDQPVTQGFSQ